MRHRGLSRVEAEEMPKPPGHEHCTVPEGGFPDGPVALTDQAFEVVSVPGMPRDVFALTSQGQGCLGTCTEVSSTARSAKATGSKLSMRGTVLCCAAAGVEESWRRNASQDRRVDARPVARRAFAVGQRPTGAGHHKGASTTPVLALYHPRHGEPRTTSQVPKRTAAIRAHSSSVPRNKPLACSPRPTPDPG